MAYEPKDIEIEEMDNGWYMVFYIDDDGKRRSLHVPNPEEFNTPNDWMLELDDSKLIQAMAENPKLIERPVIIRDGKAIIGRPTSIIAEFITTKS